jgi:hypothetical protein
MVAVMDMPADAGVPCGKITMLGALFKETSYLTHSVAAYQCRCVNIHSKLQYRGVTLLNCKHYLEIKGFNCVCGSCGVEIPMIVLWIIVW